MNDGWKNRGAVLRRMSALMMVAVLAAACDRDPAGVEKKRVASVEVAPGTVALAAGEVRALSATPRAADGTALSGRTVTWTSGDEAVVRVSAAGELTAHAPGTAVVTAESEGRKGQVTVTVLAPAPATLSLHPGGHLTLDGNAHVQVYATLRAANGTDLATFPSQANGRTIAWESSDEAVARVTAGGALYTGVAGTATITATSEGRSATLTVTVRSTVTAVVLTPGGASLEVGETVQLHAQVQAGPGERKVVWSSENEGVATVDAGGKVTARRPGSAVIRASVEGVVGRTTVFVAGDVEHRLTKVGEMSVPSQLSVTTYVDGEGVVRYRHVMITGGSLRMLRDGRYEQRLVLTTYEGQTVVETKVYEDRGTVCYQFSTGQPCFVSTAHPGLWFNGEYRHGHGHPTGEIATRQTIGRDGPAITLLFGKP